MGGGGGAWAVEQMKAGRPRIDEPQTLNLILGSSLSGFGVQWLLAAGNGGIVAVTI